ncbi:MAG: hypothetical protein GKR94_28800 [Gammaproteobacteria bacterium]|nr:hypothetical protein [Gammaproteobacteria bacterium]
MSVELEKYIVFIPNTFGPYGYELIQILAYPTGFRFRFRFDEEWVEEKVRNRLGDLVGRDGYILLRDFQTRELYPIRYLRLTSVRKVGVVCYFEYELGEIMDFATDEEFRESQLAGFRDRFAKFHGNIARANAEEEHLKPLVLLSNFEPNVRNDREVDRNGVVRESSRWMNLLASLRDVSHFENVEFLRVLGVQPLSKQLNDPRIDNGAFVLRENSTYKLDVVQYVPKGRSHRVEPNDVEVKCDGRVVEAIRGRQRAVGKYDVLSFVIRVNPLKETAFSFFDIEHAASPKHAQNIEPRIHFPIQVERSPERLVGRVMVASLFAGLYFLPQIPSFIAASASDIVRDLAVVGFAVSLVDVVSELRERISK